MKILQSNHYQYVDHFYYYGARYYSALRGIWLGVDPKADKSPNESPYAYCSNNPIKFVDPDGKEKIIGVGQSNATDKIIFAGAMKYKDDNAIHVFAHGNSTGMNIQMGDKITKIRNAKEMNQFLAKNSQIWQNRKEGEQVNLILHSCKTGNNDIDGSASFAKTLSSDYKFTNVNVIAPDAIVNYGEINGEKGVYNGEEGKSTYKPGNWRMFQNGKENSKFNGGWRPSDKPSVFELTVNKEQKSIGYEMVNYTYDFCIHFV